MAVQLPLNRIHTPEYGVLEQVAPGIRRITARNDSAFTFRGTGTFVIGEGEVAIIDPGPDMEDHVSDLLGALEGETVSHILVTHTHIDHSPACAAVKAATGSQTYGFGPHGSGKRAQGIVVEEGGDMDFTPDVTVKDGEIIRGPGWNMEVMHTPGHTSNHICFAWPDEKVLFCGDHIMGWSTTIVSPPDGDMGEYMRSLDVMLGRPDLTYLPTHGPGIDDPKQLVEALIAHRRDREDQILHCLADGPTTIAQMVPKLYADVPEHLHPAAARSMLSSVIHLCDQGRILTEGEFRSDALFRLA